MTTGSDETTSHRKGLTYRSGDGTYGTIFLAGRRAKGRGIEIAPSTVEIWQGLSRSQAWRKAKVRLEQTKGNLHPPSGPIEVPTPGRDGNRLGFQTRQGHGSFGSIAQSLQRVERIHHVFEATQFFNERFGLHQTFDRHSAPRPFHRQLFRDGTTTPSGPLHRFFAISLGFARFLLGAR